MKTKLMRSVICLLGLFGALLMSSCDSPLLTPIVAEKEVNEQAHGIILHTSDEVEEVIVFCGNPGVGKSALCNSIFQKNVFAAGISAGVGMTQQRQAHMHGNKMYIDTPGLSDIHLKEQAATEIAAALKENKHYKLVFVATLESGRIKPDDLVTINKVCKAIKTVFEYGIVFNKVSKGVLQLIQANEEELKSYLAALDKQPASVIILEKDASMEDASGRYLPPESENTLKLLNFIHELRSHMILAENIQPIDVTDYAKKVEELELKMADIIERIHKQAQVVQSTKEQAPLIGAGVGAGLGVVVGGIVGGIALGVPTFGAGAIPGVAAGMLLGAAIGVAGGAEVAERLQEQQEKLSMEKVVGIEVGRASKGQKEKKEETCSMM